MAHDVCLKVLWVFLECHVVAVCSVPNAGVGS